MGVTHVLNEIESPVDAMVWTMWCGHQCLVFDDASTTPETDFFDENVFFKSDCGPCKAAFVDSFERLATDETLSIKA